MAPLGLGSGFYGLGPTMNSDNAAVITSSNEYVVSLERGTTREDGGYVDMNNQFLSVFQDTFTAACWVKIADGVLSTQPNQAIMGTGLAGANFWTFYIHGAKNGPWLYHKSQNVTGDSTPDSNAFVDGVNPWVHIAIKVIKNTGSDTTYVHYINGDPVAATPDGGVSETNHGQYGVGASLTTDNFHIGIQKDYSHTYALTALMNEVAIWDTGLTDAEVDTIHSYGNVTVDLTSNNVGYTSSTNLVGYWKLNESTGTVAYDSSGNGNNGTLAEVGDGSGTVEFVAI